MLIDYAIKAMEYSYSPYSNFKVGAAILLKDGKIIMGANIENKSYGLTMCAERVCLYKVYTEGYKKEDIIKMAIAGVTMASPCGACREVMNELMDKSTPIILTDISKNIKEFTVGELLPFSFELEG